MLNSSLNHPSAVINQNAIDAPSQIVPESQNTSTTDVDIHEAYKQSASDINSAKGASLISPKSDRTSVDGADIERKTLKANQRNEEWTNSLFMNNARIGKTIDVDPLKGRDLGRTFQILSALISRDRIRADFNKQKFYERPGMKRKRVKCERWRKKFKNGFVYTITRVQRLKSMGW